MKLYTVSSILYPVFCIQFQLKFKLYTVSNSSFSADF